mgnify:CR=1 FL=1
MMAEKAIIVVDDKIVGGHGFVDFNEYLYGYNTLEKERVLHVLEVDAYSENDKEDASKYVNRIMTSKEIVNSSISYSEIQIINIKNF